MKFDEKEWYDVYQDLIDPIQYPNNNKYDPFYDPAKDLKRRNKNLKKNTDIYEEFKTFTDNELIIKDFLENDLSDDI